MKYKPDLALICCNQRDEKPKGKVKRLYGFNSSLQS